MTPLIPPSSLGKPGMPPAAPGVGVPPPSAPTLPTAGVPPLAPAAPIAKPAVPANVSAPKATSEVAPVTMKPSPKKETARIQIPAQAKDLPKATVRLQQTVPLTNPTSSIKPAISPVTVTQTGGGDSLSMPLCVGAFVFALIAFLIQLWIFLI
ncbi:MAG: hypothetical protein ABIT76_11785 [Chthoniobacterales bacterium]